MADTKIRRSIGVYGLGGSRDTDLLGIDNTRYDVFASDKNLDAARAAYPDYDWFACFSVKDKKGNYANISYDITFDKPTSGNLYYYYNGNVIQLNFVASDDKKTKKRVKATLNVGDPPIGMR